MTKADYIERAEYFERKAEELHALSDVVDNVEAICVAFRQAVEFEEMALRARERAAEQKDAA